MKMVNLKPKTSSEAEGLYRMGTVIFLLPATIGFILLQLLDESYHRTIWDTLVLVTIPFAVVGGFFFIYGVVWYIVLLKRR